MLCLPSEVRRVQVVEIHIPSTVVPPYLRVIRSKTYRGYVKPRIVPNDIRVPLDCYLDVVGGLVPLWCEEGRPKAVRDKVAGKGKEKNYWTEAVQVTGTDGRLDLSSEGAPDIGKTVNVKQKLISGHEIQMGLETKTDWPTDGRS
jgi:hypothetical protein